MYQFSFMQAQLKCSFSFNLRPVDFEVDFRCDPWMTLSDTPGCGMISHDLGGPWPGVWWGPGGVFDSIEMRTGSGDHRVSPTPPLSPHAWSALLDWADHWSPARPQWWAWHRHFQDDLVKSKFLRLLRVTLFKVEFSVFCWLEDTQGGIVSV